MSNSMISQTRDQLLQALRIEVENRNADDYLADLVLHFSGYFGTWLVAKQQQLDHDEQCPHCADELDAGIIGDD